jgi:hypothetical protein
MVMFSFGSAPIASTSVLDRLRIDLPVGAVSAPAPGRAALTQMLPSYVTYFQRRTLWCWAAVTMSINRYYQPESNVTQCWIANRTLGRSDCCFDDADNGSCNVQASLGDALRTVGHYAGQQPADVAEARRQIDQEQPAGIFIRWSPTEGHFASICGYVDTPRGTEFVVADPRYGNRSVLASELLDGRYRGAGEWTTLYLTTA